MLRAMPGILLTVLLVSAAHAELRDPTRPSYIGEQSANSGPVAALQVTAVFISGERRIAVINGRRLREGESIAGANVSRISRTNVTFERDGRTFSVSLRSGMNRK